MTWRDHCFVIAALSVALIATFCAAYFITSPYIYFGIVTVVLVIVAMTNFIGHTTFERGVVVVILALEMGMLYPGIQKFRQKRAQREQIEAPKK